MLKGRKRGKSNRTRKKLNMTQRKISYIECGKFEPSIDDIKEFCKHFNVSADYLIGLKKGMNYPER